MLGAAPATLRAPGGAHLGKRGSGRGPGQLGKRTPDGALTFTRSRLARTQCLLAAAALGVPAVDGVTADFRDGAALERELLEARRDGFYGKLAIHPDQVAAINAAFTPTAAECEHARRVVAAFAAAPGSGVASLAGQMIDRPHLIQAQRVLARVATAREYRMKLRIKGPSLRLRLTQGEVRALAEAGRGRGEVPFGGGVNLIYRLSRDATPPGSAPASQAVCSRSAFPQALAQRVVRLGRGDPRGNPGGAPRSRCASRWRRTSRASRRAPTRMNRTTFLTRRPAPRSAEPSRR